MRKVLRYFLIITISIILILSVYSLFEDAEDKSTNVYNHSTTMNIMVLEKLKDKKNNLGYSIKVKNVNSPFQEYSIGIDDEKLWNLINLNSTYFVNVTWESPNVSPLIESQITTLLQIENINIE